MTDAGRAEPSGQPSRVLAAGATGYLGRHVVQELKARGHWARALVRRPNRRRTGAPPTTSSSRRYGTGDTAGRRQ